jgi:hypothetical protein
MDADERREFNETNIAEFRASGGGIAGAGITIADDASERKFLDLPGATTIGELA